MLTYICWILFRCPWIESGKVELLICRQPSLHFNFLQLAQVCLGKIVDKTEQFSNWEKRPLKSPQVLYAAADAYCLLDICQSLI